MLVVRKSRKKLMNSASNRRSGSGTNRMEVNGLAEQVMESYGATKGLLYATAPGLLL